MRVRHQTCLLAAAAAVVSIGSVQRAMGVAVVCDPLSLEVQHRADNNLYLASRAQVTASGLRNGFQSNFGNPGGGGANPNAGIQAVYLFKIPALGAGETIAAANLSFSSLADSAATGVTPTFNLDLYAMGFETSAAPHNAPIDVGANQVNDPFAQMLQYVGPNQVGAGDNAPIAKVQDNILTGPDWIPTAAGSGANAPRYSSPAADGAIGSYLLNNVYSNGGFTPNDDFFLLRLTPDVNSYTGPANQRYQVSTSQTDQTKFVGMLVPTLNMVVGGQWTKDDSVSNWSAPGSWSTGVVPSGAGATAIFGSMITGNRTANVDAPQTVGTLAFNDDNSYNVAGSAITMSQTSGNALIGVYNGSHTISAPVTLASTTDIAVASGSTLKLAGAVGGGKVSRISVSGAKLDLVTNSLVVDKGNVGTSTAGVYNGLSGLIQSGLNGGSWDGSGLITSAPAAATFLTTLGVATADQTGYTGGSFRGIPIVASDAIVMYTYAGDANLDGTINPDDYALISFNDPNPAATGYYNGDFNYDGDINADDFALIDFNFNAQGAAFPTAAQELTAVPEPTGIAALGVAALVAGSARRRRNA